MTTGFPLSPLTASTFILLGLSGVSLRDHQRFVFLWAFGTTVVMTIVGSTHGSHIGLATLAAAARARQQRPAIAPVLNMLELLCVGTRGRQRKIRCAK